MSLTIDGVATTKFELKQKEGKTLQFTYNISIALATFGLIIKDSEGNTVITKSDEDFDKTSIASGAVSVNLSVDDLDMDVGTYKCEVRAIWDNETSVDKTVTFKLKLIESLYE